jgi:ferredoxin
MHTLVEFRRPASKPATLAKIVESGLCMGCGLCGAIAGSHAIDMVTTPEGRVRPLQKGEIAPDAWTQILATCPGINVTVDRGEDHDGGVDDLIWGHHHRIVLAHAGDTDLRFRSTSGGVLSALGSYLLRSRQVEFLLQVRASASEPMRSETILSRTVEEVISALSGKRWTGGFHSPSSENHATWSDCACWAGSIRAWGSIASSRYRCSAGVDRSSSNHAILCVALDFATRRFRSFGTAATAIREGQESRRVTDGHSNSPIRRCGMTRANGAVTPVAESARMVLVKVLISWLEIIGPVAIRQERMPDSIR